MNYRRVLLLVSLCVVSVQLIEIIDQESIVINEANTLYNYIFFSKDNPCSRYCVTMTKPEVFNHMSVFVKIENNATINFDDTAYTKVATKQASNCPVFMEINCQATSSYKNLMNEVTIIKEYHHLQEMNETNFTINNDTDILVMTISGSVSWFLLEIPADNRKIEAGLELTLKPTTDTKGFDLVANNAPPGDWRLKFAGTSNYSVHNLTVLAMKKQTMPIVQKIDLPEYVGSRENDSKLVISQEELHPVKNYAEKLDKSARVITDVNNNDEPDARAAELEDDLERITNDFPCNKEKLDINLAPETSLRATLYSPHQIIFTVTNYFNIEIYHIFKAESSAFQVLALQPLSGWIKPGETIRVRVIIRVSDVNENTMNILNFIVDRGNDFKIVKKSVYILSKTADTQITDYTKPDFSYSFNDNCRGKLSGDRCGNSQWSVEMTVQDSESGLLRIASQPHGVQPKTNFIAGTTTPVTFIYISTCCNKRLQVTVTDVAGNPHSQAIDVTEWDNLAPGEIAAIVIGSLFLLFIIILLILLCVYCIHKRQGTDITYTQRYGSRTTPGTERTNF